MPPSNSGGELVGEAAFGGSGVKLWFSMEGEAGLGAVQGLPKKDL
jgi:hypothetical protein